MPDQVFILPDGTRVWTDGSGETSKVLSGRWYKVKGLLHRDGGPAIEWEDGTKHWFRHGKRHREGGPAIERANGAKEWWRDGKWVKGDYGPAVEHADGSEWWKRP